MIQKEKIKYIFEIVSIAVVILVTVGVAYAMHKGVLSSQEAFVDFIESAGVFAPLVFVVIETVTVVVLILPCGLGYPVSVAAFGPFWGFVLNAIATIAGSLIIFAIVRLWGKPVAEAIVKKREFDRYERFMNKTALFEKILAAALFLPLCPDNVLCYLAGLTRMKTKKFIWLVILLKPWKILIYTYGSQFFIDRFAHFW